MTDNARKTSELPTANTIGNSDRLVFLYQANTSAPSTRTITANNFANSVSISRLRNGNATLTMSNTGIVTVTTGNTVGYIGDVELADGIDVYATAAQNSSWVTLAYSHSGNSASNTSLTGYAWLANGQIANTVDFNIALPTPNGTSYVWAFTGANSTISFPDGSAQNTAYAIAGPYADDAAAATGGIALNGLYYTAAGNVKIRLS